MSLEARPVREAELAHPHLAYALDRLGGGVVNLEVAEVGVVEGAGLDGRVGEEVDEGLPELPSMTMGKLSIFSVWT